MKCPVCKSSVESFYNSCNTCGLPFPGSEWFLSNNDYYNWRKEIQKSSYNRSETDDKGDDFNCITIINFSDVKVIANGDGSTVNTPYPISISIPEATKGTVTSLFIKVPNKKERKLAIFHLPQNVLNRQILKMRSGATVFYLIVHIKGVTEYTCSSITNSFRRKIDSNGNGHTIKSPYPINLSLIEAVNGTIVSLYIKTPNKTEYTLANFHIPPNVLSRQILTMKSDTSFFYLIVNVTDTSNPKSNGSESGQKRKKTDKVCLAGGLLSIGLLFCSIFISNSSMFFILLMIDIDIAICLLGFKHAETKGYKGQGAALLGMLVAGFSLYYNIAFAP